MKRLFRVGRANHDDEIDRIPIIISLGEHGAYLSFYTGPFDGFPVGFRYGQSDSCVFLGRVCLDEIKAEMGGFDLLPAFDDTIEFLVFSNPEFSLHRQKENALVGEANASLGATFGQDLSTGMSFHASTESGFVSVFHFGGLVCFLSHG